MTVKELIDILEKQNPAANIIFTGFYQKDKQVPGSFITFENCQKRKMQFINDTVTNTFEIYNNFSK